MPKNNAIQKIPRPSTLIEQKLNAMEKEVVEFVADKLQVTKDKASEIIHSDQGEWERLLKSKKRQLDLEMMDLIKGFQVAVKKKLENGSLEQARAGMTGIAIGTDKVYGEPGKPTFNIGGKNVQINLAGWKFKPYTSKTNS